EAISVNAVTTYNLQNLLLFMKGDYNPPLFNVILYLWLKIFPATEFFVRLPSLIFGLLTGIFIYKISKEIFTNHKIALLSLILLITSPLHIFYSQEARMYSLAAFTVSGSMYYFVKLIRTKNLLSVVYYALFTVLMLYSHYLTFFIIPLQWTYFFITQQYKSKKALLTYLTSQLLIVLFYIPWLPMLAKQLKIGQSTASGNVMWHQVVGDLSWKNLILLPVKFIIGRTSFDNKIVYGFLMVLILSLFSYLIWKALNCYFSRARPAQLDRARQDHTEPRSEFELFVWMWLIIPIIFGIIVSIKIPVLSYFRFLFCLPAFYILISKGITSSKHKYSILFAVLFINVFFSFRYLLNSKYHREDWKSAVNELHILNPAKEKVLLIKNVSAPFEYYDKKESDMGFVEEKELYVNETTIWLIPYAQPIFDPQDTTRTYLKNKDFVRTYEKHFRGVTLEKWQKLVASRYN
ncbi:MAG: glycosyltransferase family 39 protein, partial [bacterium]|nr:glycosyltransferase family 39 protein [bacterium]